MKIQKKQFSTLTLLNIVILFFSISTQAAETKIQPGFWEHTFFIKSKSGQIEAALAQAKQMLDSMPPEQQTMIKKMMADRGIDLSLQSYTSQVCITEEDAKNNVLPKPSEGCEQSITEETADGFKINYSCSGNPPVSGTGEMKLIDKKNFTITALVNTEMNGQNEEMTINQTGKWLQAECSEK